MTATGRRLWVFAAVLAALAAGGTVVAATRAHHPAAAPRLFAVQGVVVPVWSRGGYASAAALRALGAVRADHADEVELVPTQYEPTVGADRIAPDLQKTASDASLTSAIRAAQARGLKVFLAPHVDVLDGAWRGSLQPRRPAAWFQSYQRFIDHYAAIAQRTHVNLFAVGVELKSMTTPAHLRDWTRIIRSVRAIYHGPLVYDANGAAAADEFAQVPFWHQLDYVGIDAYFPLARHGGATAAQLEQDWRPWLKTLTAFHRRVQMPILFTEIGYPDRSRAAVTPWTAASGTVSRAAQTIAYEAALKTWSTAPAWFKGMFWWDWRLSSARSAYSIAGAPAAAVVAHWYGAAP